MIKPDLILNVIIALVIYNFVIKNLTSFVKVNKIERRLNKEKKQNRCTRCSCLVLC